MDPDWRDGLLSSTRRETGDPELDAIWNGTLGELDTILQDPSDPRYAKAKRVYDEIFGPVAEAAKKLIAQSLAGFNNIMADTFKGIAPIWTPPPSLLAPPLDIGPDRRETSHAVEGVVGVVSGVEAAETSVLTSTSTPAQAKDAVLAAVSDALHRIADNSGDHLDHLRDAARSDGKRARRAEVVSWIAAAAAVAAVIVSIVKP